MCEYLDHDIQGLIESKVNFEEQHLKCIMMQVLSGIHYLHRNCIIHRDIKGANILMNRRGQIKLADFGLARNIHPHIKNLAYTNKVVTLWYRAPELLLGLRHYDDRIDIWSLGCFFAELFIKKTLFAGNDDMKQLELITEKCGTPTPQNWSQYEKLSTQIREHLEKKKHVNKLRSYLQSHKETK